MQQNDNPFKIQRIFSKSSVIHKHDIYMDGDLGPPEEYREEFETIRNMGVDDIVYMRYNGDGGYCSTAIQFMKCFAETEGTVISSLEGDCSSAHSMMYLSGHGFEVSPHTHIMCHNYSGGVVGKGHEILKRVEFQKKWSEAFIRSVYEDFLTPEEVELMLKGDDFYFPADEVFQRCQNMVNIREERAKEEIAKAKAEETSPEYESLVEGNTGEPL